MRFYGTFASLLVLATMISITGCGSSSNGSSTTTPAPSRVNEWTWEGGSNTASTQTHVQPGVYGTLGVAATSNVPGGRESAVRWTDSSGNLWLFGGQGFDSTGQMGYLNDLWEFNPADKEWTWMSGANAVGLTNGATLGVPGVYGTLGTAAPGNLPGARVGAVSWIDSNGDLWLFGGDGVDSTGTPGFLNDLWEYSPASKEWTWVSGANKVSSYGGVPGVYGTLGVAAVGNVPGGRYEAVSWIDGSGNLWLFGGMGLNQPVMGLTMNDLWEFNPANKEWTWVSGSNNVDPSLAVPGVYGTFGVVAVGNVPGARSFAVSWIDSSGNLWLFGGIGADSTGTWGYLNDLWEFDPANKEWTWVSGANKVGSPYGGVAGVYGTLGVAAAGNVPGGRYVAVSWIDSSGNLWLFGGRGNDSTGTCGALGSTGTCRTLNDLWKFDTSSKEWVWMSGANSLGSNGGAPGVYGTLGVAAVGDVPGGRLAAVSWNDSSGNLWLFGGGGFDSTGTQGSLNDLWKYQP